MNTSATIDALRALRLSGMADVYETTLRLGNQNMSTAEIIAQMTEAECNLRHQRKTERLLKQARLRLPATLDSIVYSPERNLDRNTIQTLSDMQWVERGETVLVTGPTGAGKSYLACALAHEACLRGITARYLRATKLFPALQMARGDGTYLDEIKRLARTQLLIIDDFGLVTLDTDDRLALLEILDDRYNAAGTILAAQIPIETWHELIGEPTIADAIMDRLAHTPWILNLKGASRRANTKKN